MKTLKTLCIALSTFILLFSCSNERTDEAVEPIQTTSYEPMTTYMDSKKEPEQEFEITEDGEGPITGQQGTKVYPDKSQLVTAAGDTIDYPFTVKLIELYTPSQMLYYELPTVAGTTLLTTHAEVRVRAFKDGAELKLKDNGSWKVELKMTNPILDMVQYYETTFNERLSWSKTTNSFDTSAYGYDGLIKSLSWINCGKEAAVGSDLNNYTLSSSSVNISSALGFIYLPSTETLIQLYDGITGDLPKGVTAKIILMGADTEGKYFSFYKEFKVGEDDLGDISLVETTEAELDSLILGLND